MLALVTDGMQFIVTRSEAEGLVGCYPPEPYTLVCAALRRQIKVTWERPLTRKRLDWLTGQV